MLLAFLLLCLNIDLVPHLARDSSSSSKQRKPNKKGNVIFYGDSILRFAASDYCNVTRSKLWDSIGRIHQTEEAGPRVCNVTTSAEGGSSRMLMEFMHYGFGFELPFTHGYPKVRHPMLPPNSMDALQLIHDELIANTAIHSYSGQRRLLDDVDVFCLQSNLWDVQRHINFFSHTVSWEEYVTEWKRNATRMLKWVEHLFATPSSSTNTRLVWVSTCVSHNDSRKNHSEDLNSAARSILPSHWIYLDVERVLKNNNGTRLHYRDKYHLAPASTVPLVQHIMDHF